MFFFLLFYQQFSSHPFFFPSFQNKRRRLTTWFLSKYSPICYQKPRYWKSDNWSTKKTMEAFYFLDYYEIAQNLLTLLRQWISYKFGSEELLHIIVIEFGLANRNIISKAKKLKNFLHNLNVTINKLVFVVIMTFSTFVSFLGAFLRGRIFFSWPVRLDWPLRRYDSHIIVTKLKEKENFKK